MTGYDNLEHASLTDVGVRRSHNQDSHAVLLARDEKHWRERGHVFVVADGMGAHAVGELASEIAVGIIPHTYGKHAVAGPAGALRKAFIEANASIHARGQQNPEFEGMGTTSTCLVLRPEGAWIGHVGDSRAYRIRGGRIEQLSFDHSLVWEYARRQGIDPESVQGIPSNVIVRSLGPEPLVQVDVEGPHPIKDGDTFVLCSDGLSGQVTDHELGALVSTLPPEEACQFLVDLANLRGGPDNITVQIVRVGGVAKLRPEGTSVWHERVPASLIALFVGALLAAGAATLMYYKVSGGALLFVVAAGVILAGMAGLLVQFLRERETAAAEAALTGDPQIYRKASCEIEKPLLDKLVRAADTLKGWASEKHWDADWKEFQRHHDLAEKHLGQNDLPSSFREYSRSMRTFLAALHQQRNKEEVFQPVWDKT